MHCVAFSMITRFHVVLARSWGHYIMCGRGVHFWLNWGGSFLKGAEVESQSAGTTAANVWQGVPSQSIITWIRFHKYVVARSKYVVDFG